MQHKTTRILTVLFDTEISSGEIHLFRGAMLKTMDYQSDVLFHNHTSDYAYRYSYPLIQYKRLGHRAAIVCIDEGAEKIGQLLSHLPKTIHLGKRMAPAGIRQVKPVSIVIRPIEPQRYQIGRWLPLNDENYKLYLSLESLTDKIELLESILCGNILSMLKGLDITLEDELHVNISSLSQPYICNIKGVKLTAFDAQFTCNLLLPNGVGIGKHASRGFGVIHPVQFEHPKRNTAIAPAE